LNLYYSLCTLSFTHYLLLLLFPVDTALHQFRCVIYLPIFFLRVIPRVCEKESVNTMERLRECCQLCPIFSILENFAHNFGLVNGRFMIVSSQIFERVYILIGSKVMMLNANTLLSVFFNFVKKTCYLCNSFFSVFCIPYIFMFFCICVITFEPIKI
jgi:hypothetical protein